MRDCSTRWSWVEEERLLPFSFAVQVWQAQTLVLLADDRSAHAAHWMGCNCVCIWMGVHSSANLLILAEKIDSLMLRLEKPVKSSGYFPCNMEAFKDAYVFLRGDLIVRNGKPLLRRLKLSVNFCSSLHISVLVLIDPKGSFAFSIRCITVWRKTSNCSQASCLRACATFWTQVLKFFIFFAKCFGVWAGKMSESSCCCC